MSPRQFIRDDVTQFFTRKAKRDPNTGCLLWFGAVNNKGYAVTKRGYIHRFMYEAANGPIPEGLELDHLCRVTYCIEPTHLEPVTHAENMRRTAGRPHKSPIPKGT